MNKEEVMNILENMPMSEVFGEYKYQVLRKPDAKGDERCECANMIHWIEEFIYNKCK